jgi:DNA gyrase subunit A
VLLATADGMAIRFSEEDVRPMGLVAGGVGGIKLGGTDSLIGMELVPPGGEILLVSSDGKAKRVPEGQFPRQGRYGQGVVAWRLPRTSTLVGIATGRATTRLTLHLEKLAPKALRFDETPVQTRVAQGKPIVDVKSGDRVAGLTLAWEVGGAGAAEAPRRRGGGVEKIAEKRRRQAAPRKAVKEAIEEVNEKEERKEKPAAPKRSGRPAAKPKSKQAGTGTQAKRGGKKTTSEKPPAVRKRLGASAGEQLSFGIGEEKSRVVKKTPAKKQAVKKTPAQKPGKSQGDADKTGKATGISGKKKRVSRPHARLAGKGRVGAVKKTTPH